MNSIKKKAELSITEKTPSAGNPQYYTLNLGPTHPATHGIFQNVLKMDGEIVMDSEATI